jgi:hypothetical protein
MSKKPAPTDITVGDLHNLHMALSRLDQDEKTVVGWNTRCIFAMNLLALAPFSSAYERQRLAKNREASAEVEALVNAEFDRLKVAAPAAGGEAMPDAALMAMARRNFAAQIDAAEAVALDANFALRERTEKVALKSISLAELHGDAPGGEAKNKHITGSTIAALAPMISDLA